MTILYRENTKESTKNLLELRNVPWQLWPTGISAGLGTKGSPVQFPVRAHAEVVGQVPSGGRTRGNQTLMFLSLSFSIPSPRSKNKKSFKKRNEFKRVVDIKSLYKNQLYLYTLAMNSQKIKLNKQYHL